MKLLHKLPPEPLLHEESTSITRSSYWPYTVL